MPYSYILYLLFPKLGLYYPLDILFLSGMEVVLNLFGSLAG